MPFHLFSHLAGHSSLPGAMLDEELGESKQPLISMVEIPADVSPPACYTLPYRSCCTNLFVSWGHHRHCRSRTLKLPPAAGSYQEEIPFGCRSWVLQRAQTCSRHKGKLRLTKPVSVFSLRLWHTQAKFICEKLSMFGLFCLLYSSLKQRSARDHTLHLCHIWVC